MFLNSLHACLVKITKILQKSQFEIFILTFSQMTFREITRLNSTDSLLFGGCKRYIAAYLISLIHNLKPNVNILKVVYLIQV